MLNFQLNRSFHQKYNSKNVAWPSSWAALFCSTTFNFSHTGQIPHFQYGISQPKPNQKETLKLDLYKLREIFPNCLPKEMEKAIYQILAEWQAREQSREQSRSSWDRDERWFNQKLWSKRCMFCYGLYTINVANTKCAPIYPSMKLRRLFVPSIRR